MLFSNPRIAIISSKIGVDKQNMKCSTVAKHAADSLRQSTKLGYSIDVSMLSSDLYCKLYLVGMLSGSVMKRMVSIETKRRYSNSGTGLFSRSVLMSQIFKKRLASF